jgi:tRNA (uracil-5-)-methyltransferase
MCAAAVENAKLNAQLNGLKLLSDTQPTEGGATGDEAAFICSKAETVLENILTDHRRTQDPLIQRVQYLARGKKLLAVVDPPREVSAPPHPSSLCFDSVTRQGLHIDCLRAIRACTRIERLVYVSCNPTKSLIQDCVALCGPSTKRLTGTPFQPIYGTPVDLFPMTAHCEMILVFERNPS